jgi:uncharacterized membrane protein YdfJ with MMPL/SSD domain
MSELPDHGEPSFVSYVSKATFIHLWEKFKQTEQALAQSDSINQSLAASALRLGNECRDQADQVKAMKEELARVMEDLHTANDALAGLRSDHKWLMTCHKTQASTYQQHILAIAGAVQGIADAGEYKPREAKLWDAYEKAMGEASSLFGK